MQRLQDTQSNIRTGLGWREKYINLIFLTQTKVVIFWPYIQQIPTIKPHYLIPECNLNFPFLSKHSRIIIIGNYFINIDTKSKESKGQNFPTLELHLDRKNSQLDLSALKLYSGVIFIECQSTFADINLEFIYRHNTKRNSPLHFT